MPGVRWRGRWPRRMVFALIAEPSNEPTGTGGIYVDGHGRNTIVIGAGANAVLSPCLSSTISVR